MTSVTELMAALPPGFSLWIPIFVGLIAVGGTIMAALISFTASVLGAWLGANWTREREDRARIKQQRREVLVGAWSAYRDYIGVVAEKVSAEAEATVRKEFHKSALDLIDEVLGQKGLMRAAPPKPGMAVSEEFAKKLSQEAEDRQREWQGALVASTDRGKERIIARIGLEYWVVMLQITCAPEVADAYEELIDAIPDEGGRAKKRFAQAMKAELERDPALPGLVPTLLAGLLGRKKSSTPAVSDGTQEGAP